VFLVYLSGVIAFLAASTTQRGNTGVCKLHSLTGVILRIATSDCLAAMLFVTLFFESVCFPTIVALGIRGLGKHYKRGSGFIVGGVSGGAAIPPLLGYVAHLYGDTGPAMVVPAMVRRIASNFARTALFSFADASLQIMVVAWSYAVCVNFVPSYRDPADKIGDSNIGLTDTPTDRDSSEGDPEKGGKSEA
jgi:FHS family L-fucose permease-like MFS transporter